jgi:hypothetical protein
MSLQMRRGELRARPVPQLRATRGGRVLEFNAALAADGVSRHM